MSRLFEYYNFNLQSVNLPILVTVLLSFERSFYFHTDVLNSDC